MRQGRIWVMVYRKILYYTPQGHCHHARTKIIQDIDCLQFQICGSEVVCFDNNFYWSTVNSDGPLQSNHLSDVDLLTVPLCVASYRGIIFPISRQPCWWKWRLDIMPPWWCSQGCRPSPLTLWSYLCAHRTQRGLDLLLGINWVMGVWDRWNPSQLYNCMVSLL